MQGHRILGLFIAVAVVAGCHSQAPRDVPANAVPTNNEPTSEGTVVGDDKTAMEAAVEANASSRTETAEAPRRGIPLAENAPDSYVVKRGDTLWGIAKVFLRDPWFWPEIWQVNPQVQNPHLIYPGDTLRLVYINGQPQIVLQRGDAVRVAPRVRSEPLEAAITTTPTPPLRPSCRSPPCSIGTRLKPPRMCSRPAICMWSCPRAIPSMRGASRFRPNSAVITMWSVSAMP